MLSFFLSRVLCSIVGITWPLYGSFKALETMDPSDEKLWLTYWVVFAVLETIETWAGWILHWTPFYWELKFALICWMLMPGTRGAEKIYNEIVYPFLHEYASRLDPTFGDKQVPPQMHRELFKQAQEYMARQTDKPTMLDFLRENAFDWRKAAQVMTGENTSKQA